MEWKQAKNTVDNTYELPSDWLKLEYFEALNILFRIENGLRIFVYIILKDEFHDKWKDLSITSDDEESSTLGAIAKKRFAQDNNHAYLGYSISSPLLYLTAGELIRIIFAEKYWKFFKEYFLGSKEIMRSKFDEISKVRNSVAHFRPIKKGDIELIKQNSIHVFSKIEKTLYDFVSCSDIVPTNTEDLWYQELMVIGTEFCKISFKQSHTEEWVRITFSLTCPELEKLRLGTVYRKKSLNFLSDKILIEYPELSKYVISITESYSHPFTKTPEADIFIKTIKLTFSKKCLLNQHKIIKEQIEKLLIQFTREMKLIQEDNLAKGRLIALVSYRLIKNKDDDYYSMKDNPFKVLLDQNSPVEFWGSFNYAPTNFITETDNYPWMSVQVSEDNSLPF